MRKFCILAVLCLAVTASGCKKEDNEKPCPGPEVSYVANAAEGEYYARKFSKGDEYCYCVRVTAVGYDAWGLVDAWNENLSMLLYSAESYSGKGDIKIPAGTYRIGAAGETEAGTVSRDESYFRTVESDGDNSTSYYFEEGEVTVSYSGEDIVISGSFVDKSCVVRRFSYEGPCYVWNYAPDQNIEASYFYCDKKGSSDNSLHEYAIVLSDLGYDENGYIQPKGVYYEFRVFLPELFDTVFPAGTYPMGEDDDPEIGTMGREWSCYNLCIGRAADGGSASSTRYFESGSLEISYSGDNIVVEAECVDTDGGKHHVSYTGPYDFGSVTDPYSVPGAGSLAGTVSPGAVKSRPVMSRRHVGDGRAHAAIFFATFVGR